MGAHTAALQPADSDSDDDDDGDDRQSTAATTSTAPHTAAAAADADACTTCEVCFVAPRKGLALVPCGHARFCESCVNRVAAMNTYFLPINVRFVIWIITDFGQFVILIVRLQCI